MESPEITQPKDTEKRNEGGKAKIEEKFLGVTPFRRLGKDMAPPKLKILVNIEGKHTVTWDSQAKQAERDVAGLKLKLGQAQKPITLARVATEELFWGPSQFEWGETSTKVHKPKQVWVPKSVSGGPLNKPVTAQSISATNDVVALIDSSRGSFLESSNCSGPQTTQTTYDVFIQELTWLKFRTNREGECRSFRLDYYGGFNFSVPRNIAGC